MTKGNGGGTIQFSFTLLPALPATGGVQNHMPAFFTENKNGQLQVAETATYSLQSRRIDLAGFSVRACRLRHSRPELRKHARPDHHELWRGDGSVCRRQSGLSERHRQSPANSVGESWQTGAYGWQTTEHEMFRRQSVDRAGFGERESRRRIRKPTQQASAALANPGTSPITVRGTLYAANGQMVTFQRFPSPRAGCGRDGIFSGSEPGLRRFRTTRCSRVVKTSTAWSRSKSCLPTGGVVSAMVLQYVGNAMSSVEVNPQGTSPVGHEAVTSVTRCAEFPMAADGSCTTQFTLPWVVFGAGWESRLKAAQSSQCHRWRRAGPLDPASHRVRDERFAEPLARLLHR